MVCIAISFFILSGIRLGSGLSRLYPHRNCPQAPCILLKWPKTCTSISALPGCLYNSMRRVSGTGFRPGRCSLSLQTSCLQAHRILILPDRPGISLEIRRIRSRMISSGCSMRRLDLFSGIAHQSGLALFRLVEISIHAFAL